MLEPTVIFTTVTFLMGIKRMAAFAGFLMGATAAMVVERTERGDAMFLTMCDRAATMVRDHGVAV